MSIFPEILKKLTDVFVKNEDSNIGKIIRIFSVQIDDVMDTFNTIELWHSIDNAQGTTLDLIGKGFNQLREGASDVAYRVLIKSKILRDRSDGTVNNIIQNMAFLTQTDESQILLKPLWSEGRQATLYTELEYALTENTELPVERYVDIFNSITAAGVGMDIWFKGSFLFSDTYDQIQIDDEHGFGEVVNDTSYNQGDFTFSSINASQTDEVKGFSSEDIGVGGRFGAYYSVDDEKIKAW